MVWTHLRSPFSLPTCLVLGQGYPPLTQLLHRHCPLVLTFKLEKLPGVETLSPTRSLHMTSMQLVFTQARLEGNVCAPWLSLSTCDLKSSHQRTQDLDAHVTFGVSWLCDLG